MKDELERQAAEACKELYGGEENVELTRPEEQFGDFSTNAALKLAPKLGKKPREIAEELAVKLRETLADTVSDVAIAGPGFINLTLSDKALLKALLKSLNATPAEPLAGQVVVAEYSDPNPFKVLHAGHLYTSLVGDAVARLMEHAGATVHRVNFGGDVGLHAGKAMWAILNELGGEHPEKLDDIPEDKRLGWVSERYVAGNTAYEEDEQARQAIDEVNKRVYGLHESGDRDSPFARIYWTCRQWSYDGFEALYKRLDMVPFEKYYPESTVADLGIETVRKHTGKVYEESEGAVIFRGEKHGLFTQVFISSQGLPTYAAKDVGLIYRKHEDFSPDRSFIITDTAQKDHLAVVLKSVSEYAPELVKATTHYAHGQIKLAGGAKMSSRKGNILRADDILRAAHEANLALDNAENPQTELGAVKYAFLKVRIGGDIIYDPAESISLEGNSGPYLQYAHARARSILSKAGKDEGKDAGKDAALNGGTKLEAGERTLARKIGEYSEAVDKAVADLMPHHVCTYLYDLAQTFNRFYEANRVLNDPRQSVRLGLVLLYADTLRAGLSLLGMAAPDKM
jgi:arginyl-tRNA synthetase